MNNCYFMSFPFVLIFTCFGSVLCYGNITYINLILKLVNFYINISVLCGDIFFVFILIQVPKITNKVKKNKFCYSCIFSIMLCKDYLTIQKIVPCSALAYCIPNKRFEEFYPYHTGIRGIWRTTLP